MSRWLKGDFSREDWIVALVTGVFAVIFLIAGNRVASVDPISAEIQDRPVPAKVLQVLDHQTTSTDAGGGIVVSGYNRIFSALITGGDQKGETVTAVQSVDDLLGIQMDPVDPGDRVLLYYSDNGSQMVWMVGEFDRTPLWGSWAGLFCCCSFFSAKPKGPALFLHWGLPAERYFLSLSRRCCPGRISTSGPASSAPMWSLPLWSSSAAAVAKPSAPGWGVWLASGRRRRCPWF